ncbi:hypothetical protein RPMA_12650 [Tardiphaga alba]|uniref:Phage integrase family protein n=1 Tax=Tardiphaga alba TaxID=340268 RepID=A0ABX8A8L5_9BRAD|nr:hypothetical protein [Tardiphaga alba]QUS39592.1 hypothetical protein RPMA_12650 [Tardiphaga alba]
MKSDCRDVVVWTGRTEPDAPVIEIQAVSGHVGPRLRDVIDAYQTDPLSSFHKQRFHVRQNHAGMLRRIRDQHGSTPIGDITGRTLIEWHAGWKGADKVAMAHSMVGQLRTVFSFGFTHLADPQCERISQILHRLKFPMAGARTERITADQADAVRTWAHIVGWHSIALAQALQFELILRQKDVIGEWVPLTEPGDSDEVWGDQKWLRGLRWSEVSDDLILRHVTSKRQKPVEVDLTLSAMVMEELAFLDEIPDGNEPVIINEATGMPWTASEYRRKWRIVARYAGVPDNVFNMDSRSGGISEAFEAGVTPERIQKSATHSDLRTTGRYNRGDQLRAASEVQLGRASQRRELDSDVRAARWHDAQAIDVKVQGGKRRTGGVV